MKIGIRIKFLKFPSSGDASTQSVVANIEDLERSSSPLNRDTPYDPIVVQVQDTKCLRYLNSREIELEHVPGQINGKCCFYWLQTTSKHRL